MNALLQVVGFGAALGFTQALRCSSCAKLEALVHDADRKRRGSTPADAPTARRDPSISTSPISGAKRADRVERSSAIVAFGTARSA